MRYVPHPLVDPGKYAGLWPEGGTWSVHVASSPSDQSRVSVLQTLSTPRVWVKFLMDESVPFVSAAAAVVKRAAVADSREVALKFLMDDSVPFVSAAAAVVKRAATADSREVSLRLW